MCLSTHLVSLTALQTSKISKKNTQRPQTTTLFTTRLDHTNSVMLFENNIIETPLHVRMPIIWLFKHWYQPNWAVFAWLILWMQCHTDGTRVGWIGLLCLHTFHLLVPSVGHWQKRLTSPQCLLLFQKCWRYLHHCRAPPLSSLFLSYLAYWYGSTSKIWAWKLSVTDLYNISLYNIQWTGFIHLSLQNVYPTTHTTFFFHHWSKQ